MKPFAKILYAFAIIALFLFALNANSHKQQEIERLSASTLVLADSLHSYRVLDSLNAVQTKALRLTADEYRELYESEYAKVGELMADRKGLEATIALQSRTIRSLQALLQPVVTVDTLVVFDTIRVVHDTVYCFDYSDKWVDLSGCINGDTLNVDFTNRDELLIVESAQRKRFLGIPLPIGWFGYKSRTVDVVSDNPNTVITNVNYKTIEK